MESRELVYWLTLSLLPGMNSRLYNRLLEIFTTPRQVLAATPPAAVASGLTPKLKDALAGLQAASRTHALQRRLEQALRWSEAPGQAVLTMADSLYPDLLKAIPDPPPLLYVRGDPRCLALPQIAMVGSRRPTPGGGTSARRLAAGLGEAGFSICSGLALGIDAQSHEGALSGPSSTIAVLGCGLDLVYPPRNRELADRIAARGALISEFPLGSKPLPPHFPRRNRIISGLSQGTVVVEAALRSGSLITAKYALEQGREVFAVPGSIHSHTSAGCHWLLKNGAKLVENIQDILEELGVWAPTNAVSTEAPQRRSAEAGLDGPARRLLEALDYDTSTVDSLVDRTGLCTDDINALLTELELRGLIQSRTGGYALAV